MEDEFGKHIKTTSQPWWLALPLLVILLIFSLLLIQKNSETKSLIASTTSPKADTKTNSNHETMQVVSTENILDKSNTELQELIDDWVIVNEGEFAVVVSELGGLGRNASINHNEQFISASTYKLFVVYAVLHKIENSSLNLQSQTSLGRTVEDCIESLLIYSWDICGYPMGDLVGWNELDELLFVTGFKDTDINNYNSAGQFIGDKYTTANDEALFMELLYRGELLNSTHTNLIINALINQKWRERIPAGVPDNIQVADKPGWLFDYENDAAIVYGDSSTYVLVVLSNNSTPEKIAELSSKVYELMNQPLQ